MSYRVEIPRSRDTRAEDGLGCLRGGGAPRPGTTSGAAPASLISSDDRRRYGVAAIAPLVTATWYLAGKRDCESSGLRSCGGLLGLLVRERRATSAAAAHSTRFASRHSLPAAIWASRRARPALRTPAPPARSRPRASGPSSGTRRAPSPPRPLGAGARPPQRRPAWCEGGVRPHEKTEVAAPVDGVPRGSSDHLGRAALRLGRP